MPYHDPGTYNLFMTKLLSKPLFLSLILFVAVVIAAVTSSTLGNKAVTKTPVTTPVAQPQVIEKTAVAIAERPALTPAEEAYISQLWKIHDKVKHSAFQLTFAGMSYKLGNLDRAGIQEKVVPQTEIYRAALADMAKLTVPPSLREKHQMYSDAVKLYEQAALELVKVADDGKEQHLLDAHALTERASSMLLQAGDQFWPGEFKPH